MTLAALFLSPDASAFGPDWDEIGDAGQTPATAQRLWGAGSLASISGRLGLVAARGDDDDDLQDMYLLRLEQPTLITFSASTDGDLGGSADFDTRLWLFDADGFGLLANDDADLSTAQSTLFDASTDGTGVIVTKPGLYFLAVTGAATEPLSDDDDEEPIFTFASATEISGPDGAGGDDSIEDWSIGGEQGTYDIALTGVTLFAPGDLNGDGAVDVMDLFELIGAWGSCADCITAACIPDLNSDCVVNVVDLFVLLDNWG